MASAQFNHSVLSAARGIDEAWAGLQKPETWATIAGVSEVTQATFDASGNLTAYLFTAVAAGREYAGKADVRLSSRPTDMVVSISTSELTGQIATRLTPTLDGIRVAVTLDLQSRGLLAGMMFAVISGAVRHGFPVQVERLSQHLKQ